MKLIVHIGYPKCMSTSLQRGFFSQHEDIHYLGIGIHTNLDFRSSELTGELYNALLYANEFCFYNSLEQLRNLVSQELIVAKEKGCKQVALSLENLSFSFSPSELDPLLKLERLRLIFKGLVSEIQLLAVLREQTKLLKSLYGEYIKAGLVHTFKEYICFFVDFRNLSTLNYFLYYDFYTLIRTKYPDWNFEFVVLEDYLKGEILDSKLLMTDLCKKLCIKDSKNINIPHANKGLTESEIYRLYLLNIDNRQGLGLDHFSLPQLHKLSEYFDGKGTFVSDFYKDIKIKNENISKAVSENSLDYPSDFYNVNFKQYFTLEKIIKENNKSLKEFVLPQLNAKYI